MSINSASSSRLCPIIANDPIERFCSQETIKAVDNFGKFRDFHNYYDSILIELSECRIVDAFFTSDEFLNNQELSEAILQRFAENGDLPHVLKEAIDSFKNYDFIHVILKSNAFKNMPMLTDKMDQEYLIKFLDELTMNCQSDKQLVALDLALNSPHFDFLSCGHFRFLLAKVGIQYEPGKSYENELLFIDRLIAHPNFQKLGYDEMKKILRYSLENLFFEVRLQNIHHLLTHNPLSKKELFSIIQELKEEMILPNFTINSDLEYSTDPDQLASHGVVFGVNEAMFSQDPDDLLFEENLSDLIKKYDNSLQAKEIIDLHGNLIDAHYEFCIPKWDGISKDDFRALAVNTIISRKEAWKALEELVSNLPR